MKTKYSFILPVYNVSKFLPLCLDSILAQSYTNWEAILVDDGSKDNSWKILQDYAAKDNRIKTIHQENAGAGAARNLAINKAAGEWIVFVDSDDYISNDYLALLDPKTADNDVVYIDILRVTESGKVLEEEKMSKYKDLDKDSFMRYQMTGAINWGGVRKCVRTSLLKDNNIRYCLFKNGEEALLTFQEMVHAKSFSFIDEKPVYYYVEHQQTLSSLPIADPWGEAVVAIKEYVQQNGLYEQYASTINAFNVAATVVSIDRLSRKHKGAELKSKINERMKQLNESFDTNYKVDTEHMLMKAKVFVPFLTRGITWPSIYASKLRKYLKCYKKIL